MGLLPLVAPPQQGGPIHSSDSRRDALRIALGYTTLGILWIVGTDLLARTMTESAEQQMWVEILKGAGFVVGTGLLLFWWIRRELASREEVLRNYRTLTEQAPDLIFRLRLRPEPAFDYVSPAAVNLAGFTPREHYEELETVLAAVHPEDRGTLEAMISDPDTVPDAFELRWRHREGGTVWVEFRITRHRNERGRVEVVEGVARDITERRKTEKQRSLLATAVEAAGEAVLITNAEGVIEYVNPAFTQITGYEAEEVIGETPSILKSGRQEEAFYDDLWQTITAGRTFRGEMVNRRKDGTLYDQEATITPVPDDQGEIRHFVAVCRDVTVRRELDRQLLRAYKMEAAGQMAAGISHDFRNLLNVIHVNAELLRTDEEGLSAGRDDVAAFESKLEQIRTAADRGAQLVNRLLMTSKETELDFRVLDLADVVEGMEDALRAMVPESVSLDIEVERDLPVKADEGSLEHVLLNLVNNAAQAMPAGGSLTVALEKVAGGLHPETGEHHSTEHGELARLTVADTGRGMDEETLSRVFEPFFTTRSEGTGLGLAMVRSLAEQHGGRVYAESRPGEGARFEIFLPLTEVPYPGSEDDEVGGAVAAADLPVGSEEVLMVEDEAALRRAAERMLTRLGYSVTTGGNGREALDVTLDRDRPWDLVVTDLIMPEMGGVQLFESLQNRGLAGPIVFMSGYAADETGVAINPDRSRHFLQKPWTVQALARTVRGALDTHRERHSGQSA